MPVLLHPRRYDFPDPAHAEPDGLVAVGGDFKVGRLLRAYASGIFPWTDDPITWWSPDPRAIFEIEKFIPQKRLLQKKRAGGFTITFDQKFRAVMEACAAPAPGREETWISAPFIAGYTALHTAGHAHSVEVWQQEKLVGGLYGVAIGGFFAGESMFHQVTDASKIALVAMMSRLRERGYTLFDTQVATPLTRRLGAVEITRSDYLTRLKNALDLKVSF